MKALMKRLLPESALAWLRGCESDMKLRRETLHQMKRFRRNYARRGSTRKSHLETRIVFFTHQIEKGLSHTDFRYGFGKKGVGSDGAADGDAAYHRPGHRT